jgi:histidinol-phosphate aminotransferase
LSKYWSKVVGRLQPYVPGEQPRDRKYIKLNTNENPYGPSPRVLEAIKAEAGDSLKLYPDPSCDALLEAAAEYYGVSKGQIFAGNGSDEVLAFSFMAFFDPGRTVLFPDITYTFYPVYTSLFGLDYRTIPVNGDFSLPVEEFYGSPGGVIIANPNAPTGRFMPSESVARILENNREVVVIVDEAYINFGGESAVGLIKDYPNLLVIHTFSKYRSLAGMRLGFAIGHHDLITGLNMVKNSFNSYTLDRLAIIAGTEAFRDNAYYDKINGKVVSTRKRFSAELKRLGFDVPESVANFVFAAHAKVPAAEIFAGLKARGILVRYFDKPRISNRLRISIGTESEMDCVLRALREILNQAGINHEISV